MKIDTSSRNLGLAAALILSSLGLMSTTASADNNWNNDGRQRGQNAQQQHNDHRNDRNQRRQDQRKNQAQSQNRERQQGQRQQYQHQQAQRQNEQRQRDQRQQAQRQQNQYQQAQRQNEQRQRDQRQQAQRQQNQYQQAQRQDQQRQRDQWQQSQRQHAQRQQAQHYQQRDDHRNGHPYSYRNDNRYAAVQRHIPHGQGWDRWRTSHYVSAPRYTWGYDRRSRPWFDYNRSTYISIYRPTYIVPSYGYGGYGPSYSGPVGCGRDVVGAVMGGVAGGLIGAHNGGGGATFGGAIIGAILGGALGHAIDLSDQACYGQVLEYAPSNQPVYWESDGGQYQVTPLRTYQTSSGEYCREYQTDVYIDGQEQQAYGTACRQPDGAWRALN